MISRRELLQAGFIGALNYAFSDLPPQKERERIIRVTKFGQYGHMHGLGSLGFDDNGKEITDPYSFVDNAVNRHRIAEQAFGRPLAMHIDLPSYHSRIIEDGEKITVFSQNTGAVIHEYFDRAKYEEIPSTLSICIVPPSGSTGAEIENVISRIFNGEMNGLPKYVLAENIDKISMTIDFEYMVMGDFYAYNGPINHIPISLVKNLNSHYVSAHNSIQKQSHLSFDHVFVPEFQVYNFGINAEDDMYDHGGETSLQFPHNIHMISDAIGSLDFKALSTKNFSNSYGIPVSTMFFLPGSPKLLNDGRQSDSGIGRWDYAGISRWARAHSRSYMIMTH